MIPKKLHYVWIGGKSIPKKYQDFIDNWARQMPEWEIVRWDEMNFNIKNSCDYCRQAFVAKRWAFVSDYIRIKVLYEHGGIYLDTDEDMIRSIDRFSVHSAFFGLEAGQRLQAGVFGCEAHNEIMGVILEYYHKLNYIVDNKQNNIVIGTHFLNVLQEKYPFLELKEEVQNLGDGVFIYPSRYFCPDLATLEITEESYTVHRPMGSWLSPWAKFKKKVYILITQFKILNWLYRKIKR